MENGKIDFIVCEKQGCWYFKSLQLPEEISIKSNEKIVEYAKEHHFKDELIDIIYIGVYWRDSALDEKLPKELTGEEK